MKIAFTPVQNLILNKQSQKEKSSINYQYGLTQDTVSFGAIKKSKLDNYQLLCANYFKAPLEKFNSKEELKNWAKAELEDTICPEKYPSYLDFPPYDIDG